MLHVDPERFGADPTDGANTKHYAFPARVLDQVSAHQVLEVLTAIDPETANAVDFASRGTSCTKVQNATSSPAFAEGCPDRRGGLGPTVTKEVV